MKHTIRALALLTALSSTLGVQITQAHELDESNLPRGVVVRVDSEQNAVIFKADALAANEQEAQALLSSIAVESNILSAEMKDASHELDQETSTRAWYWWGYGNYWNWGWNWNTSWFSYSYYRYNYWFPCTYGGYQWYWYRW
jgi:hypothetical protein